MKNSNNEKIAYVVAAQYDNLGDLIINSELIKKLAEKKDVLLDVNGIPEIFVKFLNISENKMSDYGFSFRNLSFVKYLLQNKIRISSLFFSAGPKGIMNIKDLLRAVVIGLIIFVVKIKGGKTYYVGVDMNVYSFIDIFVYKYYVRVLGVRYYCRSYNNVANIYKKSGIKVDYIPDICFLVKTKYKTDKKSKIGFSFRELANENHNHDLIRCLIVLMQYFIESGFQVCVFYQVKSDYEFNENIYKQLRVFGEVRFRKDIVWYNDIEIYNDFDVVFSNRLHVLLLGMSKGVYSVPLVNKEKRFNKIIDIYNDIGLGDMVLYLDDKRELFQGFLGIYKNNYDKMNKKFSLTKAFAHSVIEEIIMESI